MKNDVISSLIIELQKIISQLKDELEKTNEKHTNYSILLQNISLFINKYECEQTYDFSSLDTFIDYLLNDGFIDEKIDYKNLYAIRSELYHYFPDRVYDIDNKFAVLINACNEFSKKIFKEYEQIEENKTFLTDEIKKSENSKHVLEKLINNFILSEEEINYLDELKNIVDVDLLDIYRIIVENNYKIMQSVIVEEQERLKKEELDNKLRQERTDEIAISDDESVKASITEEQKIELSDIGKKLLSEAKKIINENDVSDKKIIESLNDCTPIEALNYMDVFDNPRAYIAKILNYLVIPAIKNGELLDYENVLRTCILKYYEIEELNDINYRLISIGRNDIIDEMETANNMLSTPYNGALVGYVTILRRALEDLEFAIKDDEIFNLEGLDEYYSALVEANKMMLEQLNKEIIEEDDMEDSLINNAKKFYDGANNLIVFPDGVDVSKQVDEDITLKFEHKRKILTGLERLSREEDILQSSRHKVKDDNDKYLNLRSYKGPDYRIVYRVYKASGLDKIFGKKVNVVFVVQVGYGATSEKSKFYSKAKAKYDMVENNINEIIGILNSNDEAAINKLLNDQLIKMAMYINECSGKDIGDKSKGGKK